MIIWALVYRIDFKLITISFQKNYFKLEFKKEKYCYSKINKKNLNE